MRFHSFLAVCLAASPALADENPDVQSVAETYLNALTGAGDENGKQLLLGGATMDAQLFTLENWRIVSKDPVRKETGDLGSATKMMRDLDKAGQTSLRKIMDAEKVGDDLTMTEISQADAAKLVAPTQEKSAKFLKVHPVLAYVARATKELYWHPKNPIRKIMGQAGTQGKYYVEVHRMMVESKEGPRQSPRQWPLRVVKIKTAKLDTGWKILPASDWSVE